MTDRNIDTRAIGWTVFAAVMMWLNGLFLIFVGLVGVFSDEFYPDPPEYIFRFDDEVWGWTHFVTGVILFVTGVALLTARLWARTLAVVIVSVSMLEAFVWVPTHPIWSVIILAVGAMIIWALTIHGHDIESRILD